MILSMTGYGKGTARYNEKVYTAEIKSLNSKSTDIRCRFPSFLNDKEFAIRKLIQDTVVRGRIEVILSVEGSDLYSEYSINKDLFRKFYGELKGLSKELSIESGDILSAVMRIPSVTSSGDLTVSDEEWEAIEKSLMDAIEAITVFRKDEGLVLANDFLSRVKSIKAAIPKLEPYELARIEKIKERLRKHAQDFLISDKVDQNRFEQEILYYLERMDITEEKVRLSQHCDYFIEQMDNGDSQVGKILNFISQEMGREINTLGSKAQDSEMQQIVVVMKDELEKIKEQLANIL